MASLIPTVNGRKPSVTQLKAWKNQIESGKATYIGLERDKFGSDAARGKRLRRIFEEAGI